MTRTDITELFPEATKEQIDKLMGINGADINKAKGDNNSLTAQLTAAQQEIEKLKAAAGEPDQLAAAQNAIKELQDKLTGMETAETVRKLREKVAGEKKVPAALLTADTEEACAAQADSILAFAKSSGYPSVKDGGEPNTTPTSKTRDKFAEWAKDNF